MTRLTMLATFLVLNTMPLFAQGQQPNVAKLKADAQKVVTIISSDTAKFHTYWCPPEADVALISQTGRAVHTR